LPVKNVSFVGRGLSVLMVSVSLFIRHRNPEMAVTVDFGFLMRTGQHLARGVRQTL